MLVIGTGLNSIQRSSVRAGRLHIVTLISSIDRLLRGVYLLVHSNIGSSASGRRLPDAPDFPAGQSAALGYSHYQRRPQS